MVLLYKNLYPIAIVIAIGLDIARRKGNKIKGKKKK